MVSLSLSSWPQVVLFIRTYVILNQTNESVLRKWGHVYFNTPAKIPFALSRAVKKCSWHSLAKFCYPLIVLRKYRKASRGKALVNISARWWVVHIFSTVTFRSNTYWLKWCSWTERCLVLGWSLWVCWVNMAIKLTRRETMSSPFWIQSY